MLEKSTIEAVLDCAVSTGGDFAEVFCEDARHSMILANAEQVETNSFGRESGVGIRIFSGLNCIYAYTTDKTPENLVRVARDAASALKGAAGSRQPLDLVRRYGQDGVQVLPAGVPFARKMEVINRAVAAGKGYSPEIVQMSVKYLDMEQHVQIANTEGLLAEDTRVKTRLYIRAIAQRGNVMESGYYGPGAMRGFEYYDDLDIESYAKEAARIASILAGAEPCPGGKMDVVVENGFGGLMFHEACGHSLEASSVAKGTSEFSGKLGQQIASPLVTLVDDGSISGEWGSLHMDDEGTPTQKNVLIENGILKSYMIDKLNARRMGAQSTGSGRRQNYRYAPVARMTNTYIQPGQSSREDIISATEKGLFVKYINAGSVNPATGDFNFSTSECYLIENGKLTRPVKGATLIGNGGSILKQVDMVGDNLELRQGYCYAASGALFVDAGQPTVRVKNMTVGGLK